ncbi:MAG: pilus (MSHA type) biogenesis protein MshL [Gallionellaceae bacterium]|nr:MAG: pilus (MSHA type) biogenesis protein MshL [Gallionellaceae bacterium]
MKLHHVLLCSSFIFLAACSEVKPPASTQPLKPSDKHIQLKDVTPPQNSSDIPQANKRAVPLPAPKPGTKVETYSVVVTNVSAQEILFALARDAKINLDINPGVQGNVTLNAINQTLPQILNRISKQVDMRYELENGNLIVMPDSPYLKAYKIDYVNMTRDSEGGISNATQVGAGAVGGASSSGNNSQLSIKNSSKNHFWERLESNIKDILRETDKILPEGSSETFVQQNNNTSTTGTGVQPAASGKKQVVAKGGIENSPNAATIEGEGTTVTRRNTFREAASVISNPENGIITVRATARQHEKIQEFVSQIMASSRRQVLIEATIVEVRLSEQYQQGINWSNLRAGTNGFQFSQVGAGTLTAANTGSIFTLDYANPTSSLGALAASVKMMESFGKVKVLSSPKLSVMNNQTAMLRVVDNYVYFTINATTVSSTGGAPAVTTYSTTSNSVPVGFTMSVTPQINENDSVLLNMRPSITRLFGFVNDPNPDLAKAGVVSQIPQTQTREMESVLKIDNNQIAVMGGLMQDEINNQADEVPLLGHLPYVGNLFKYRNDKNVKSELVIFLRPMVIKEAGIDGDYSAFRNNLPNADFFNNTAAKNEPQDKRKP